jgi:hypothetical protein
MTFVKHIDWKRALTIAIALLGLITVLGGGDMQLPIAIFALILAIL